MRLNLGCGPHYAPGWINVDRYPSEEVDDGRRVDLVADLRHLPYADGSVDRIYMGHVIEHLPEQEVEAILARLRWLLADDGGLMVVGPDIEKAEGYAGAEAMIRPDVELDRVSKPGLPHLWLPTESRALTLCRGAFAKARAVPVAEVACKGWPLVSDVGWQFAIWCPK